MDTTRLLAKKFREWNALESAISQVKKARKRIIFLNTQLAGELSEEDRTKFTTQKTLSVNKLSELRDNLIAHDTRIQNDDDWTTAEKAEFLITRTGEE
jgi:hypothetical protein